MSDLITDVEILFETDELAVLNKPAGLVVHADGRTDEPNLCDWILETYPEAAGVGESIEREGEEDISRPGIVHRLDRDTSGAIIIARTNKAHAFLKAQFQKRLVKKTYAVFARGQMEAFHFSNDNPIGRAKKDFRQYATPPHTRGKTREAETSFQSVEVGDKATFLKAFPKTGRTHQIRVHLMDLGHPVVCDKLYGQAGECLLGFDRLALHAEEITFHLTSKEEKTVFAPLPADFTAALEVLKSEK